MIGLILAGGRGMRMRPLSNKIPKPMLKVCRKPIIQHLIDHLRSFGIGRIFVDVRYKPEKFKLSDVMFIYEPKLLGEIGTAIHLLNYVDDDLVVLNGDTLTEIDIEKMHKFHLFGGFRVTKWMTGNRYLGTMIVSKNGVGVCHYKSDDWRFHINTPAKLKEAERELYKRQ